MSAAASQQADDGGTQSEKVTARFELLNLLFTGNIFSDYQDDGASRRDTIQLDLDGFTLRITQVLHYEKISKRIRQAQGIATTAHLTALVDRAELPYLVEAVDRVCDLLTFATANLVTWVRYRATTADGQLVAGQRRAPPTRGYSGGGVIDRRAPEELTHFVQATYSAFKPLNETLQLHRVAHAYVDVITSGFLETKALLLGVLGEYLVVSCLEHRDPEYRVVPRFIARPLHKALLHVAREFLSSHNQCSLLNVDDATNTLTQNLQRVADPTLKKKLERVNALLGANIEPAAMRQFVQTRNDLAHRMRFVPEHGTERAQYQNMKYVIDCLLLGLLEYDGPFTDFRTRETRQFSRGEPVPLSEN